MAQKPGEFREKKGSEVASYGQCAIYGGFPFYFYDVLDQSFSGEELLIKELLVGAISGKRGFEELERHESRLFSKNFLELFREKVIKPITYNDALESLIKAGDFNSIKLSLMALIKEFFPHSKNHIILADRILSDSIGYGKLAPLVEDENLEEVMVNGYDTKVFVFHKTYGHCKTNVSFPSKRDLDFLLQKIARTVDKKLDSEHPLLDARLPDGNRANATFTFVTPFGPSLTIRKFTSIPLSIVDLIANNTMSSEVAAFLWVMVEGLGVEQMNIIITGGSGSGKTTTLNALSAFIRYSERVVSIEDTLELQLSNKDNWVQMEARPRLKGQEGVTMDDLLKNSMRMRPDRLIVGEVRGPEAQTLFIAMDTGHKGILGTLHSNSAKEMFLRLKNDPMNVPEPLIPLLNLVVVQYRFYVEGRGLERRIFAITELTAMETQPLVSNVYEWDRKTDSIKRTNVPMRVLEIVAEKTLKSKKEVEREIYVRRRILEWMLKSGIHSQVEVAQVVQQYYYDPGPLLEKVLSETSE